MEVLGRVPKRLCAPVTTLECSERRLESWRCGRIVTAGGRLKYIQRRWIGYRANLLRVGWEKRFRPVGEPECVLLYHHGWFSNDYLVLGYAYSHPRATTASLYCASLVLDEVARIKGCHAIVTELTNDRLSDRLLARWGWERHCLSWSGRHFIKRFYGNYPAVPEAWRARLCNLECDLEC